MASVGDLFTSAFFHPSFFFSGGGKTNRRAARLYRPQSGDGRAAGDGSPAEGSWLGSARLGGAWGRWAAATGPARSARGAARRGGRTGGVREEGWL